MMPTTQRVADRFVNVDRRRPACGACLAAVALALALTGLARAEDDDYLDMPRLGAPIPERLQQLEDEWAEDEGTKDALDEPVDPYAEPGEQDSPFAEEPDVDVKPSPPEEPPLAKRPSGLGNPLENPLGTPDRGGSKSPSGSLAGAKPEPSALPNAAERSAREVKNPEE